MSPIRLYVGKNLGGKTVMWRRRSALVLGARIRIGEFEIPDQELDEDEGKMRIPKGTETVEIYNMEVKFVD